MPAKVKSPTEAELKAHLGPAFALWSDIIQAVEAHFAPLDRDWKPSKLAFGRMCLLRHKKRTLLYLTPDQGQVWIAIVLGERAFDLAMKSPLPAEIKRMFREAKPYAEGRGIRFAVDSPRDVATIMKLLEIKTAPK